MPSLRAMANRAIVLQANLHHAKAASAMLVNRFVKENIGLALIQEPWIRAGQICGLSTKQGKLVYDRKAGTPRAAILLSNHLDWFPVNQFTSRDLVAVYVTVKTERGAHDIICASAYFPGEELSAPPIEVQDLVQYCRRTNTPFLIGCDANAHHTVWGSTDINVRGESLLEFILKEHIHIANRGNRPTFANEVREEVLDLTLCSETLADNISDWHVSDEPSMSDHMNIRFKIDNEIESKKRGFSKRFVDWKKYSELLTERVKDLTLVIETTDDLEQATSNLTETIMSTFEESSTVIRNTKARRAPWWSDELETQQRRVKTAFNKARRGPQMQLLYKRERNKFTDMIRTAKVNSWRKFCGELENIPETARLHRLLAKDGTNGVGTLLKADGSHTSDRKETLEVLLSTHFPGSTACAGDRLRSDIPYGDRKRAHALSGKIFSSERVEWAIGAFQPFKAAGEDGIFPALLQKGIEQLKDPIGKLFRASFTWGYIPTNWRKVNVIFLPKANKPSDQAKSYRPVSLTSFLLKTMEKLLDVHLRNGIEATLPLSNAQFAYRKGKSTELALHKIVTEIERTIQYQDFALGAFLDIEGAFDNTGYDAIMRALSRRNIDRATKTWVHSMLADRLVKSTLGIDSQTIMSKRGCPQGGVLSPLLWSLVVDELLTELQNGKFTVIGYADDIAVFVTGKFDDTVRDRMKEAIGIIMKWCRKVGLNANPQKTTLVPFTRRLNFISLPLEVEETPIKYATEVKYLGVILDQRLNWEAHMEHMYKKATRAIYISSSYCGRSWGVSSELMLSMYRTTVRPIMEYAAWIWWSKTDLKKSQNKLNAIQRLACLSVTGAMRSTPTAAMEAILGLMPLHIHIKGAAASSSLRYACLEKDMGTTGHMSIIKRIPNWEYLVINTDISLKERDFNKTFNTTILKGDVWSMGNLKLENNTSIWYTDGSKTNYGTGSGVYGPGKKISVSLGKAATIFQAELEAIRICTQHLVDLKPKGQRYAILSDSQAAIRALTNIESNSYLVRECLATINKLTVHNKLQICWVPGHTGVDGNEEADELARNGASTDYIGPEPVCGLNWSASRAAIGEWKRFQHKRYWNGLNGLRQSKNLIDITKPVDVSCIKKQELRKVVGYLTGHNSLRYHLYNIGMSTETDCRLCNIGIETSTHILCECRALDRIRYEICGRVKLSADDIKVSGLSEICKLVRVAEKLLG